MGLKEAIEAVKRHLWGMDYSVKDLSDIPGLGYHLLVGGTAQLIVMPLEKGQKPPRAVERKGAAYLAMVSDDGGKLYAKGEPRKSGTYRFSKFIVPRKTGAGSTMYELFGNPKKGGEET